MKWIDVQEVDSDKNKQAQMEDENNSDNKGTAAATLIVILSVIIAIFMFFVVSVIEEEYSRAEITPKQEQKAHTSAVRTHVEMNS
jgi:uncharacterized protein YqhQ